MQILKVFKENWSLLLFLMAMFLLIILYFEYRRWNLVWKFNHPSKFNPKSEYYFIYSDYLKWWRNFLNNPEKISLLIQQNFLSYLESEYPNLVQTYYNGREEGRIIPFLDYVKDPKLREFLLDPINWIKPHLKGKEKYFRSQERDEILFGLSKLTTVFYDLHKSLYAETGVEINEEWQINEEYKNFFQRKLISKKTLRINKIGLISVMIILILFFTINPFITLETSIYVLLISISAVGIFLIIIKGVLQKTMAKNNLKKINKQKTLNDYNNEIKFKGEL